MTVKKLSFSVNWETISTHCQFQNINLGNHSNVSYLMSDESQGNKKSPKSSENQSSFSESRQDSDEQTNKTEAFQTEKVAANNYEEGEPVTEGQDEHKEQESAKLEQDHETSRENACTKSVKGTQDAESAASNQGRKQFEKEAGNAETANKQTMRSNSISVSTSKDISPVEVSRRFIYGFTKSCADQQINGLSFR